MSQHGNTLGAISHHTVLIYIMVLVSAADRDMTDVELLMMDQDVQRLLVFRSYDIDMLP